MDITRSFGNEREHVRRKKTNNVKSQFFFLESGFSFLKVTSIFWKSLFQKYAAIFYR